MAQGWPLPVCCASCESRTIAPHCPAKGCRFRTCAKCGAITAIIRKKSPGGFKYARASMPLSPYPNA